MAWYLLLILIALGLAWLLLNLRKDSKIESLNGLHDVPLTMIERDSVIAIVKYRSQSHSWDIEFVGVTGGADLWDELTEEQKILTNAEINLFFNSLRSSMGIPY